MTGVEEGLRMLGPLGMRGVVRSMGRRGVGKASEPALAALAGEWQSFLLPVTEVASCLPLMFSYNTVSYTVHYIRLYTIIYFHHHHHLEVRSRASCCRNPDGKQPALDTQPTISKYFLHIFIDILDIFGFV